MRIDAVDKTPLESCLYVVYGSLSQNGFCFESLILFFLYMMVHYLRFFCILIPQNNSDGCSYTSSAEQCYLDFVGTSLGNIDSFSLHNKYMF